MEKYSNTANTRIFTGLFIFIAGILLFAYKMGAPLPHWLFSWPWILIGIGLIIGLQSSFRSTAAYILLFLGAIFLLKENQVIDLKIYLFPLILMVIGASIFFSPKGKCTKHGRHKSPASTPTSAEPNFVQEPELETNPPQAAYDVPEFLTVNAILGGVKKRVLSKNFTGGNITTFMGGAEISFIHADMQKPVLVECNNIFGGTKLLIPANWDVKNEVTAIFGGVEDKRNFVNVDVNPQKSIYLKGTCLFGGIEIANY